MAKELRKYRAGKIRERRAKEKIQSSETGGREELRAECRRGEVVAAASGRSAEPGGGSPELLRFPRLAEEAACARLGGRG